MILIDLLYRVEFYARQILYIYFVGDCINKQTKYIMYPCEEDPFLLDLIANHRKTKPTKTNLPNEADKCLFELVDTFKYVAKNWCKDESITGNMVEFKAHLKNSLDASLLVFKNR